MTDAPLPPFDQRPAWMTWVDIVEKYGDPHCTCGLCVALRAWIQQSAERTETRIMELENATGSLEKLRTEMTAEEWERRDFDLMKSTLAAEIKLRILLQGWAAQEGDTAPK